MLLQENSSNFGDADDLSTKLAGKNEFRRLDRVRFTEQLACLMAELNALHPLRELWRRLSLSADDDLDFGLAFDQNYAPLIPILCALIPKKQ
jgi:hypothetical protein